MMFNKLQSFSMNDKTMPSWEVGGILPLQSSPYINLDGKAGTLIQTKDEHKQDGIEKTLGVQSPMISGNTPQGDDKLQSLSAKPKGNEQGEWSVDSSKLLGALGTLQSPEVSHTSSVDTLPKDMVRFHETKSTLDNGTAEGTFLTPPIPTNLKPSAVTPIYKEMMLYVCK